VILNSVSARGFKRNSCHFFQVMAVLFMARQPVLNPSEHPSECCSLL